MGVTTWDALQTKAEWGRACVGQGVWANTAQLLGQRAAAQLCIGRDNVDTGKQCAAQQYQQCHLGHDLMTHSGHSTRNTI